jgi:hypothetical protein
MTNDSNRTPSPTKNGNNAVPRASMHSMPQQPSLRQLMMITGGASPLPPRLPAGMMVSSSSHLLLQPQQLSQRERRERLADLIQEALDMVDDHTLAEFQEYDD